MTLASFIDLPALQAKNFRKTLRKYQGTTGSIVATPYKILSREDLEALKSRTWLKDVAAVWATFDAPTKLIWKNNASNIGKTGWILFMSEYSYRRKYALSLPPSANALFQMYGMQIADSAGDQIITAERYDISVTGPIEITFSYKKIETSATGGLPFQVKIYANYFEQGENKQETYTWQAPSGNQSWQQVNFSFGTSGRYYFELITEFMLDNYQASAVIDNLKIEDSIGVVEAEPWHVKAGKDWLFQVRTRKMGWEFNMPFGPPYYQIVYTGA